MNYIYEQIKGLFEQAGVMNFEKLPADVTERRKFAIMFRELNDYIDAAKVQGFTWDKLEYSFKG